MKKYAVAIVVFALTLGGLTTESHAQFYSGYTYNNNAYVNYAIASQRARAAGRKARPSKKHRSYKSTRRGKSSHHRSRSHSRR